MEKFNFCPKCAGKFILEKRHGRDRYVCSRCGYIFYQNPRPTVGVFIVENNKILLAKRAINPYKGWWDTIGGFMEEEETPKECAIRETKEETGLDIEILDILGVGKDTYQDQDLVHTVPISYTAKMVGGTMKPDDDVAELKWFDLNNLPENVAFESNKKALHLLKTKSSKFSQ